MVRNRLSARVPAGVSLLFVTSLAAWLRVRAFERQLGGMFLAIGPDASDWVTSTMGLARGDAFVLKPNRYLLVPWLAVQLSHYTGLSEKEALLNLAFYSGVLLPPVVFLVARRFLSLPAALAVSIWVAVKPEYIALSLSPIAYPVFCLAFVGVVGASVGAFGRVGLAVAILGGVVAGASLNQGMVCLLVLLPAALLARRWGVAAGILLGGATGVGVAQVLQPDRNSAFGWILRETFRYLSGNVAEETARFQASYGDTWLQWADLTFQLPGWPAFALVLAGCIGLVLAPVVRGRGMDGPGGDGGTGPERTNGRRGGRWGGACRGDFLGLTWSAAPMLVLVPLMASAHHLIHLEPLLAIGVGLAVRLIPWTWGRVGAGTVVVGAVCLVLVGEGGRYRSSFRVDVALEELALGNRIEQTVGERAVLLAPLPSGQTSATAVWRAAWALPLGVSLYVLPEGPGRPRLPVDRLYAAGMPVWVVSLDERQQWPCGPFVLVARGDGVAMTVSIPRAGPGGRRDVRLYLYPVDVVETER